VRRIRLELHGRIGTQAARAISTSHAPFFICFGRGLNYSNFALKARHESGETFPRALP
jgi:hypothetical protein